MPRTKTTRNPFGSILTKKVKRNGKTVTFYDARKRYRDHRGTPTEKFKRCLSHSDAMIALTNFQTEIERELGPANSLRPLQPDEHTFFELTDYFEVEYLKEAVFIGDKQISGYRQDIRTLRTYIAFFKNFLGNGSIPKITYENLRRLRDHIASTPTGKGNLPTVSTINRKLGFLRRILNVGIQLGWLQVNPFKLGKPLIDSGAENTRERVLEFEEERRLLAACEEPEEYSYTRNGNVITVRHNYNRRNHLRLLVIFAIDSGMRKREMFTTSYRQIDIETQIMTLNPRQTKALRRRVMPISDRLAAELQKLFALRNFEPNDLIFDGVRDCRRAFKTACKRAGIENLTFHDLRHTAVTWMDEAGITRPANMNFVGHTRERTHQRYTNVSTDVLNSARQKMNEFRRKIDARMNDKVNDKVNKEKATSKEAA